MTGRNPQSAPPDKAAEPKVHTEIRGCVGLVTLDDQPRRNAMTLPMGTQIEGALARLEADPSVKAIVVTGAGTAFCAGADLTDLGEATEEKLLAIYQGFLRFGRCPLPTIAAVNGAAVGAGMNLALICDLRLAGRAARFDDRFLQLGIHPGGGHTWMFQNLVGPQSAAASILFSEAWDGPEAERRGLVHRCVNDDELVDQAVALASSLASVPKELVIATKATMGTIRTSHDHDEAVQRELGPQVHSANQPAFRAKLQALVARISSRPPRP